VPVPSTAWTLVAPTALKGVAIDQIQECSLIRRSRRLLAVGPRAAWGTAGLQTLRINRHENIRCNADKIKQKWSQFGNLGKKEKMLDTSMNRGFNTILACIR
jgi:hypothetical protein